MTRTTSHNQSVGALGERMAAEYLEHASIHVVDRNWRCTTGELDLVAIDHGTLVAIEVKTRYSGAYGSPLEAITHAKTRRLRRLLHEWRETHAAAPTSMRIDAIGITLSADAPPHIDHLRGIA